MRLALLAMLLTGCVQVDKRITVINVAPFTATRIEAVYESDTSTDAKPELELSLPIIP